MKEHISDDVDSQAETVQEKQLRKFLFENGIAFEQHKRVLGDGEKTWIVDFYLPEHSIVVEAKYLGSLCNGSLRESSLGGIYKDAYKLDELIRRYNLIGVIFLHVPSFIFAKKFIPNLNSHKIYCITEPIQLLSIIQKARVEYINSSFQPKIPEPPPKTFSDEDHRMLWAWARGASFKSLGLRSMELNRKVRKYIINTLENRPLDDTSNGTATS